MKKEIKDSIIYEILIRDNSFIYIIANLDLYNATEQNLLKKIFKTLIKTSKDYNSVKEKVKMFFIKNANLITNLVLDILARANDESMIFRISKIIKYMIENSDTLPKILNFEFFKRIYNLTKSEKFVYSTEAFKILCV